MMNCKLISLSASMSFPRLSKNELFTCLENLFCKPLPNLCLSSRVAEDGLGDIAIVLTVSKLLKKSGIPHFISLMNAFQNPMSTGMKNLIDSRLETGVKLIVESNFDRSFHTPDSVVIFPAFSGTQDAERVARIYGVSPTSVLVIDEPGRLESTKKLRDEHLGVPRCNYKGFGFSKDEIGMLFSEEPKDVHLTDFTMGKPEEVSTISDSWLRGVLLNREGHYDSDCCLGFSYQHSPAYTLGSLYQFLAFSESDYQNIDFILKSWSEERPSRLLLLEVSHRKPIIEQLHPHVLKEFGIGSVQLHVKGREVRTLLVEGGGKKQLRLIDPYPLDSADFKSLMAAAKGVVGVTGLNSVMESMCMGKIMFPENRVCVRDFVHSIQNHYLDQNDEDLAEVLHLQSKAVKALVSSEEVYRYKCHLRMYPYSWEGYDYHAIPDPDIYRRINDRIRTSKTLCFSLTSANKALYQIKNAGAVLPDIVRRHVGLTIAGLKPEMRFNAFAFSVFFVAPVVVVLAALNNK